MTSTAHRWGSCDPVAARFWSHVRVLSPNACWEWRAGVNEKGYGKYGFRGRTWRAHRVAFELAHGPCPVDREVMHLCDNKQCCNPSHLEAGTREQNMRDARVRGLMSTRLTAEQVRRIRSSEFAGMTHRAIARELGVTYRTIGKILDGSTWRHLLPAEAS